VTVYLDLADFLLIAEEAASIDGETLLKVTDLGLADSAIHAPQAGFGGIEAYPDISDKAAVLVVHLAKNHALPDGNKRSAWLSLITFLDLNGWKLEVEPTVDEAVTFMVGIAGSAIAVTHASDWLRARTRQRE
jgi:death on curing protein